MNWENQNVRYAVAFVVGLIVGLGLYWAFDQDTTSQMTNDTNNQASTTVASIQGDNGLIVAEQQPGKMVTISDMALKQPTWVAIRDDINGTPGPKILGATLFDANATTGTVELLRATEAGKSYFAILHVDDGNTKAFDSKIDKVLKDPSGSDVMVHFTVAGSNAAVSADQPAPTPVTPIINIGGKE
jgi:hypothetical protein